MRARLSVAILTSIWPVLLSAAITRSTKPQNYDVRDDDSPAAIETLDRHLRRHEPGHLQKKASAQQAFANALKHLGETIPGADVIASAHTGGPEVVGVARGRGKLTPGGGENREQVLRKFLLDHADLYGLGPDEIAHLVKTADYMNPAGNLAWLALERRIKGRKVFRGEIEAAFTPAGELVRTRGELPVLVDDDDAADAAIVSAPEAIAVAAASIGIRVAPGDLQLSGSDGTSVSYTGGPFVRPTRPELQYFPLDVGAVDLVWSMTLWLDDDAYWVLVSAEIPDVLFRKNISEDQTQPATYSVYNAANPAPLLPSTALPGSGFQAPGIARTSLTLISELPLFDNLGWLTDGVNTTTGNNVDAGLDLVAPDGIDPDGRPTGSPFRVFDFPYNPPPIGTDAPSNVSYRWGEVAHMFFWANRYHDLLYQLGFTEAARNFQTDNFGRGGIGGDPVLAEAQDYSGTNNANFSAAADGTLTRMQMYVFTGPNPARTSTLEQDVLLHELTHGTSIRLHGNGTGLSSTMSRGMGEGWSDFYAKALIAKSSEDVNGIYPSGPWVTLNLLPGFTDNYYYGIRRFPYTVMSNVGANGRPHNPLTFADIDPAQIDLTDGAYPRGPAGSPLAFEVHASGEVWAMALFEMRARLIQRLGFDIGNQRTLQLVTDAMKLDPLNPTFLQGRDSILAADCASYGGADELDIWSGFAVRGMGYSARAVGATSSSVTEAFDVPNLVIGTATVGGGSCAFGDGVADPGETVALLIPVTNPLCAHTANDVVVSIEGGSAVSLGTIPPGGTVPAVVNYTVPTGSCGTLLHLAVTINSSLGAANRKFDLRVGTPTLFEAPVTYTAATPVAIPDVASVDIPIVVTGTDTINKVDVKVRLVHQLAQDLILTLIAPDGTRVTLARNRGIANGGFGTGANDCTGTPTTFDDSGQFLTAGGGTYVGTFRPETPLSVLNDRPMNGTWKLRVTDANLNNVGTVGCAQLEITRQDYYCCGVPGTPLILSSSRTFTAESATPANGAADPDETVTVQFALRNFGTGVTSNLVATLLPNAAILAPSGPQSYGVIVPLGTPVSRPFTFVARGSCGDSFSATLKLQDGDNDLGTVTFPMRIGLLRQVTIAPRSQSGLSIPDTPRVSGVAPASIYPITITVPASIDPISKVTVTLFNFIHPSPADVDVLLVGPGGQTVVLMSDVALPGARSFTFTFDDSGPLLTSSSASGTYRPTNNPPDDFFPAPAPAGPYGSAMSVFNGTAPGGTWALYVVDDTSGPSGSGSLSSGWGLTITTRAEICIIQSCTLSCPAPVTAVADPGQPGAILTLPLASVSGGCGVVTSSPTSPSFFPIGTTTVTDTATRADGTTTTCTFPVQVLDDEPPKIAGATATPNVIDDFNHKMIDVEIAYTATDNSGVPPLLALTVSSNEPIDGLGDGDTSPDWEIVDAHHVRLRGERAALGTGRIYTITITATDAAGNASTASVVVTVPHDLSQPTTRNAQRSLHPLEDQIVLAVHAAAAVDVLGRGIAAVDVETDAADVGVALGDAPHVLVQPRVDALAAVLRPHVDALDPPDVAVAPVAPLVGDHHRRDDAAVRLGDEVAAARRLVEDGAHAARDHRRLEIDRLGLAGHGLLKLDDQPRVCDGCFADSDFHLLGSDG
jgi:subtilisin-like proprotein convertase family protein